MDFEGNYPLLDFESFNARFEELIPVHNTLQGAYEATEKEVKALYNHPKYRNYDSFRKRRSAFFNKRRSNRWNKKPGFGRAA